MEPSPRRRAEAALADHDPALAAAGLSDLGHGLDHHAFLAGDLVVRVAGPGEDVSREARLLALVAARSTLPVPTPVLVDVRRGVLVHPYLPGRPLLGREPGPGAAEAIGAFLRDLHATDPDAVAGIVEVDDDPPAAWLEDLDGPAPLLDRLRREVPEPTAVRVLAHADLGAEHLLDLDGRLTGVVDWSDAALADPAVDLARLLRDLGPAFVDDVVTAYGGIDAPTRERMWFLARSAALEDLAHGRATGQDLYTRNAVRSLTWLFPAGGPVDRHPGG